MRQSPKDQLFFFLLLCFFYLFFLGYRPLDTPDEARYVQIAMEMATTGDWLTPRLNGIQYFEKPPFVYWLLACMIHWNGGHIETFYVRLIPAMLGLVGLVGTYHFVRLLMGQLRAVVTCGVLGTSLLYFTLSRIIILDIAFSVWITFALFCAMVVFDHNNRVHRAWYQLLIYFFLALAVLTKGLAGVVLPGGVIFIWMLFARQWKVLSLLYWWPGLVLFFGLTVPWHLQMSVTHPGFPYFYFIYEHFERYLTSVHKRDQPVWFYLPMLVGGFFPWIQFLPQALKRLLSSSHDLQHHLFLRVWACFIFLFFSFSTSKLIPYIVPCFPPVAIMIAGVLIDLKEHQKQFHRCVFVCLLSVFVVALWVCAYTQGIIDLYLHLVGASVFVGVIAVWMHITKGWRTFYSIIGTTIFCLYPYAEIIVVKLRDPHLRTSIEQIKQILQPGDQVYMYNAYFYTLPVLLNKRIPIIGCQGKILPGELFFGTQQDDPIKDAIIHDLAHLKNIWSQKQRVYLFLRTEALEDFQRIQLAPWFIFAKSDKKIIISNQK